MPDNSRPLPMPLASAMADPEPRRFAFSWHEMWKGQNMLFVALGACWLWFFSALDTTWQLDPQYNYGFLVPLLGLALLLRRWPDRPVAIPGHTSGFMAVAVGLLFLQLPLNLILEANPTWPLMYWTSGMLVVGLTFCFLYEWGGRKWLRHFWPVIIFMLVAVPWPSRLEEAVTQGLMNYVARLTIILADILGVPALQHGNVIQIRTGLVGVNEACSGVRSLQSALMVSLFLGEMHRFSWLWRGVLLVASLLLVVVANILRTTTLVWVAAQQGLPAMTAWHDAIGIMVMAIVLPSLLGLAWYLKQKIRPHRRRLVKERFQDHDLSPWVGVAIMGWLVTVMVATELWYHRHDKNLVANPKWTLAWPVNSPAFQTNSIPEASLELLRCSSSAAATWVDAGTNHWSAFTLRWNPGKNSEQLAATHKPELCFPAIGARLQENLGQVTVAANGLKMPFRHLNYLINSNSVHVFFCVWPDRFFPEENPLELHIAAKTRNSRLAAVLAGRRPTGVGQRVLEITVAGPETSAAATALLRARLPLLIQPDGGGLGGQQGFGL